MFATGAHRQGRSHWALGGAVIAAFWCAGPVAAQGVQSEQLPAVKAQKTPAATGGGGGGEVAALRQRVEQLEGQLVDLQVVIGTLDSLARTGGGGPATSTVHSESGGGFGAGDSGRVDSIETQIRALTAQVEQLSAEFRQLAAQRRSDSGGAPPSFAEAPQTSRFGSTTVTSDNADPYAGAGPAQPQDFGGAGSGMPQPPPTYGAEQLPPPGGGDRMAAVDPSAGGNPKQVYETAYGHLLQQDYGAAQAGFRDFLKNYPQDPLAPNALYWLGEAHYVQRNYSEAAEAFDLVIQAYASSGKAPDAQLKRGMALAQLGKRQDACSALRSVGSKFPNAPPTLKAKADGERQRIGCP